MGGLLSVLLHLGGAGEDGEGAGEVKGQSGIWQGHGGTPGGPQQPTGAAVPLKLLRLVLGTDTVPVMGTGEENL